MYSSEIRCDHTSVGVIVRNEDGAIALLERARPPEGIAPAAGHIDSHGSPEQTAVDEVWEELGLRINPNDLRATTIAGRIVRNSCRRIGGDHHRWWVFEAVLAESQPMNPSQDETRSAAWYTPKACEALAARTRAYQTGRLTNERWRERPGLEPVWLGFLAELGYVRPDGSESL